MQRLLIALAALTSLCAVNIQPTLAQKNGQSTAPTVTPQETDASAGGSNAPTRTEAAPRVPQNALVYGSHSVIDNVTVSDRPLVLAGHVRNDVIAYQSDVTILHGAAVGGHVIVFGGHVDNQAGAAVKVVRPSAEATRSMSSMLTHIVEVPSTSYVVAEERQERTEQPGWFGGQFGLFVLGMLGGLILLVAAPRATQQVAESVALRPGRSLAIGGITGAILMTVLAISNALMHLPRLFSLMWSPFGAILALGAGMLLAFGWLSGMRYAGDRIARQFGRPVTREGLFARMALGLGVFFLANGVLGSISRPLGVAGLTLEFVIALMGLGAAVATRFGKESFGMGAGILSSPR